MADWKKVIVSGSSAELSALSLDTALTVANGGTGLTATGANNFLVGNGAASLTTVGSNGSGTVVRTTGATGLVASGSFSGSFQGDGSNLTGVVAGTPNALEDGNGIANFSYDGNTSGVLVAVQADSTTGGNTKPVAVSANGVGFDISTIDGNGLGTSGGELVVNVDDSSIEINSDSLRVKASGVTNAMLVNDSIQIGTTDIALGATGSTVAGLTLTGVTASGSFSGSFQGDGSGLTGLASTLNIDADGGGPGIVDLLTQTFDIAGGTNINTQLAAQTITVNLDPDISVTNATVTGDLTVNGTASFANTENLLVADRFVLFASGSTTAGDGGIVVQQGTQNIGEVFAFENTAGRWGIETGFNASASAYTPAAYMGAVVDIDAGQSDIAAYQKNGNIKVDSGDIYIYS
jgi:hypothetical protein